METKGVCLLGEAEGKGQQLNAKYWKRGRRYLVMSCDACGSMLYRDENLELVCSECGLVSVEANMSSAEALNPKETVSGSQPTDKERSRATKHGVKLTKGARGRPTKSDVERKRIEIICDDLGVTTNQVQNSTVWKHEVRASYEKRYNETLSRSKLDHYLLLISEITRSEYIGTHEISAKG